MLTSPHRDATEGPFPAGPIGLQSLGEDVQEALALFAHVPRQQWVNHHGGDVGCTGCRRNMLRHTANYALARELAGGGLPAGPVVDVGGGVGALGLWLARRLERPCWLVEPDHEARRVATAAFPDVVTFRDVEDLPAAAGAVVVAMEVVEHISHMAQHDFICALRRAAAPGALIALSTPDEGRYFGGSSGYRPHIGTLTATQLHTLLVGAGLDAALWRLEGPGFRIPAHERLTTPMLNTMWYAARQVAPRAVDTASRLLARGRSALSQRRFDPPGALAEPIRAVPAAVGIGTGLFAAARTPYTLA